MTTARKMLMETLVGHLALLEAAYPRKASSQVARKARQYARMSLKQYAAQHRRHAA
ncbi:MAG TPA: hypothetical protein VFC78_10315 [Tepidisphaeraceae bacterium]|nr:hypothetical protein [Tepidisphaeraceae bacterium]